MSVTHAPSLAQRSPFGRLLSQGTLYTAGMQLSNCAVVLPIICAHQGLGWAAGLIFPLYGMGALTGNSISPAVMQRSGRMRHLLLAAVGATVAAMVLLDAVIPWTGGLTAAVFLLTCVVSGVVVGIGCVAYPDLVSNKLSASRRGELLLTQGATGSVLATTTALLVVPMLAHGNEMTYRRDLLWLGATGLAASGIAALFVGPMRSGSITTRMSVRDTYRQGFAVARTQPWFRRYVITYLLFAPVNLGTFFYTLRIAHQSGSVRVLVILSSVGLVVGSALWRKFLRLFGVRGMMLGSALLGVAAIVLCIVAESSGQWSHMWAYGTAFFLATVAGQAIFPSAISWISVVAAEEHRGTLIGFASTLFNVASAALGAALGAIAQVHTTVWPDVIMLLLGIATVVAALGAPAAEKRRAVVRRLRTVASPERPLSAMAPAPCLQAA
ncbi:MFS transporter [Mycobacterium sp. SMC-2]|uniref:MFS transporter n=1 Tax=Mycobacterium sp. SMC-2 TaxID=2857058 RepID=UPI0021B3D9A2|nr:MFS transporter [Mycobacterium sp. SMC-2]UXA08138.1 MFS transporter [Mycobacterium sp. SMC-2]